MSNNFIDFSGEDQHRQIGVIGIIASVSQSGVMCWHAIPGLGILLGSNPALGAAFPIVIPPSHPKQILIVGPISCVSFMLLESILCSDIYM